MTDTACFSQECVALWRDMIIGGQGVLLLTVLAENKDDNWAVIDRILTQAEAKQTNII